MSSNLDLSTFAHLLTDEATRQAIVSFAISEELKQFRRIREDRKRTPEDLSVETGIPVKTITEIEEGRFVGNVHIPQKLAHALGCTLAVSFESFGSLPQELEALRNAPKSRIPVSYEHDPIIFSEWPGLSSSGPDDTDRVQMVRRIKAWHDAGNAKSRKAQLVEWLNGYRLPPSIRNSPSSALASALGGVSYEAEAMFSDRIERLLIDTSRWMQRNYCQGHVKRIAVDWSSHPLTMKRVSDMRSAVEIMRDANKALGELIELAGQKQLFGEHFRGLLQSTWRVLIDSKLPDNQNTLGRSLSEALDNLDGILSRSFHRELWSGVKIDPATLKL